MYISHLYTVFLLFHIKQRKHFKGKKDFVASVSRLAWRLFFFLFKRNKFYAVTLRLLVIMTTWLCSDK